MKRSAALTRLSREHHPALVLAKRAQGMNLENEAATSRFMTQAFETFTRELEPHFQAEEAALLPALASTGEIASVRRTLTEHAELRRLANRLQAKDATSVRRFGEALEAHVRFEERELFALAESVLTPEALAIIEMHQPTTGAKTMNTHIHLSPDALYPFDARGIAKRFRHAAIFGALDALNGGETMRFVNDHDPLPLLNQLRQRYGEKVDIQYRKREPGDIVIDFVKKSQ